MRLTWIWRRSLRVVRALAILIALLSCCVPLQGQSPTQTLAAVDNLRRQAMRTFETDVNVTSNAFADAENLWRSLRIAYTVKVPLTIIEETISVVKSVKDISAIKENVSNLVLARKSSLPVMSFAMAINSAREAGTDLQFALDGPGYSSAVAQLVNDARQTQGPLAGYPLGPRFDGLSYANAIVGDLSGTAARALYVVVKVPRMVTSGGRNRFSWQPAEIIIGTHAVSDAISKRIDRLRAAVTSGVLTSQQFMMLNQTLQAAYTGLLTSNVRSAPVQYSAYRPNAQGQWQLQTVTIGLGSVAGLENLRSIALGGFDKDLQWEEATTVTAAVSASLDAIMLTKACVRVGAKSACEATSQILAVAGIGEFAKDVAFRGSSRDAVMNIPQEMMTALPTELSNLLTLMEDLASTAEHMVTDTRTVAAAPRGGGASPFTALPAASAPTPAAPAAGTALPSVGFTISANAQSAIEGGVVSIAVPANGSVSVLLDAARSRAGAAAIIQYLWLSNGVAIGTGQQLRYTFGTPSNRISLRVTDQAGRSAMADAQLNLSIQAPTATGTPYPAARPTGPAVAPIAGFAMTALTQTAVDGGVMTIQLPANGTVSISLDASRTRVGSAPVIQYQWLNNGNVVAAGAVARFLAVGPSNRITLRVTDANAQVSTAIAQANLVFQPVTSVIPVQPQPVPRATVPPPATPVQQVAAAVGPTAGFTMAAGTATANDGGVLSLTVPANGSVAVTFDAGSRTRQGTAVVTQYQWLSNGTQIGSGSRIQYLFGTLSNSITLRVTDASGHFSTAQAQVNLTTTRIPTPVVAPFISRVSPSPTSRSSTDQALHIAGTGFSGPIRVLATFPNGSQTTLSGAQVLNVSPNGFDLLVTLGAVGNWAFQVINGDGTRSNTIGLPVR